MTLNAVGEERCVQCGAMLELEPEPVPTQLLCPRGCGALAALAVAQSADSDAHIHNDTLFECERCGGVFVTNEMLVELVTKHRPKDDGRRSSITPPTPAFDAVVYLPCPSCNVRMNRTIFGKSSGVIVDVCKGHGTWFDARELTASLAFVERGGLELVAKREAQRKADEARAREVERRTHSDPGFARAHMLQPDAADHAAALRGLLDILISL